MTLRDLINQVCSGKYTESSKELDYELKLLEAHAETSITKEGIAIQHKDKSILITSLFRNEEM